MNDKLYLPNLGIIISGPFNEKTIQNVHNEMKNNPGLKHIFHGRYTRTTSPATNYKFKKGS